MRIQQYIFVGVVAVAFVIGCIKASRKMLGAMVGGFLGLLVPISLAAIYVWRGGDPTAAGVFSFFALFTIPIGIVIGISISNQKSNATAPPAENEFRCLSCGGVIHREDKSCPTCGWTWK
jgi:hypothetical protein